MQRAPDPEVVERARADSSVVLTFDLDFGEVLALGVLDKPSVIIFRLADERSDSVNQRLAAVLAEHSAELDSRALILVEDTRCIESPFIVCRVFEHPLVGIGQVNRRPVLCRRAIAAR